MADSIKYIICINTKHIDDMHSKTFVYDDLSLHLYLHVFVKIDVSIKIICLYTCICNSYVHTFTQNLQPLTDNGDVSKSVKNSRVGRKNPKKQTNKHSHLLRIEMKYFTFNFGIFRSTLVVI